MSLLEHEARARGELVITMRAMWREYNRLVASFWDWERLPESMQSKEQMSGVILGALRSLWVYQQGWYIQDPDIRGKDTYLWCLALHDCTKYLACDDRYKEKGWATKDDRFKGVYQNNYYFRRRWVAFLRQIMEYVVLINRGEFYPEYLDVDSLQAAYRKACRDGVDVHTQRAVQHRDLKGYDWERMKRDLDSAQQKIDAEPASVRTWANLRGQRAQRVEDLLEELRQLHVSTVYTENV